MAIQGVDYSSARPDPKCLFTEGKRFAVRYTNLGAARAKTITLAEATALTNAGLRVVTIFEETAGHMLQRGLERTAAKAHPQAVARAMDLGLAGHMARGPVAGAQAASSSWALGKAAGMHPDAPHYFALDVDPANFTAAQWQSCADYLDAAAGVLGKGRIGLYGNDQAMDKLRDHVTYLWQTYAWSEGRWASGLHLRQYKNNVSLCGGAVDLNDALVPDYGQWGVNVAMATDVERTKALAISCDPIPYRMTVEISRQGIDCSGFMSLLCNSLRGLANPWVRLFATGNIADLVASGKLPFLHPGMGDANDFSIGVMYPSESSSGIGHMAGTLAGFNVESRGGVGVVLGADARGATNSLFKHHFHMKIDNTGNVGESDAMSAADVEAIKNHIDTKFDGLQPNLDRLALWVAGRPNRVYSPAGIAERLKVDQDFESPLSPATLRALISTGAVVPVDANALAVAVVAALKAQDVIKVDVDEAAIAGPVANAVTEALRKVTFTATS